MPSSEINPSQKVGFAERFCGSALYAAGTTLLGTLTGFLGSLFHNDIKRAFPFSLGPYNSFSIPAFLFWLGLLMFAFLFFFGQKAGINKREREQDRLIAESKNLSDLVRSLPPKGFLTKYAELYSFYYSRARRIGKTTTTDDLALLIRSVLEGIAVLTSVFDESPSGITYYANIMLFTSAGSFPTDEAAISEIKSRLRFSEPELDIFTLDGILELQNELSTSTAKTGEGLPEPDNTLNPFALPVPKAENARTAQGYRVLPGAPFAYFKKSMVFYSDTSTLGNWFKNEGDFAPSVRVSVEEYFQDDSHNIRGFASLPLFNLEEKLPFAVLNIHRDRPGLLRNKDPEEQFVPLMEPFAALLGELIITWMQRGRQGEAAP